MKVDAVARSVTIAARSGSWVIARRVGPVPMDWLDTRVGSRLPWPVRRRLLTPLVRLSGASQTRAGIPRPRGRAGDKTLCISDELIGAVRRKEIEMAPNVVELIGDRVRSSVGRGSSVWATASCRCSPPEKSPAGGIESTADENCTTHMWYSWPREAR